MAIAVYAGSFDPLTLGHLAIVREAARIFAHVRVLVAVHPTKKALLSIEERVSMIDEVVRRMPQVSVDSTDKYVVEYAREIGAGFLIRGIRTSMDADDELNLAKENRELAPEVATLFLAADPTLAAITSTDARELARSGGNLSRICPPSICARLEEKLGC